jgi:hypothetical protein
MEVTPEEQMKTSTSAAASAPGHSYRDDQLGEAGSAHPEVQQKPLLS